MNRKSRFFLLAGLLTAALALLVFFTVQGSLAAPVSQAEPAPLAAAAKTSFPGLEAANGEPDLPGLHTARPARGQVLPVQGPFDDRLVLENLAFDGTAATGAVKVTSDVSDLLELQVLAGFYDDQGTLLGTASFIHHLGSEGHNHTGPPEEREEFSIPVPADLQARAVSASVGVPVLVNE
jgi:hypothetical protein